MYFIEDDLEESFLPKRKKLDEMVVLKKRNPVAVLNELKTGLKYEVLDQKGPAHAPEFTVSVIINGQQYAGTGKSKKLAKCKAAEEALKSFIQFPNHSKILMENLRNGSKLDFTSDTFEGKKCQSNEEESTKAMQPKGAVMLLNELFPSIKYECIENESDVYARFRISISVNGETFVGTG